MAKLPALVSALAKTDGRERAAVDHIARVIRERGYITTGKRGGGAAEMNAHEAANLIIALACADTPKDAPIAVNRFRSLCQEFAGTQMQARSESYARHSKPAQDILNCHTFGEAIDALVVGVPETIELFHDYFIDAYGDHNGKIFATLISMRAFGIEIIFQRYHSRIEIFRSGRNGVREIEFAVDFGVDTDRWEQGFYGYEASDRRVVVTIGLPTLVAAWRALNPRQSLPGFEAQQDFSEIAGGPAGDGPS